jgi:hypothetical protein
MCREEALRVACRLEAPHGPLALAGWLGRIFGAVVQIPVLPMFHTR